MSTEQNKTAERRVIAELNKGNWAIVDELVTTDYVYHGLRDREASTQFMAEFGAVFPDFRMAIEDTIAAHRLRATRYLLGV